MYKILIVDDDLNNLKATKHFLAANKYEIQTASTANEALGFVNKNEYALALLDYRMPDMMGDVLAGMIKKVNPNQQIAMYSCDETREAVKNSMKAGATDFVEKNSPKDLLISVTNFCKRYDEEFRTIRVSSCKSENRSLIEKVGMVGESRVTALIALKIMKFAKASDTSVLILGESGTGKELAAQALHKLSSRAKGNFVALNCAAIPKELLESMLFGHRKGSFTGATQDSVGQFVHANNGTIFLDEIGDMSLDLQAKLLRVLQEREVTPVGAKIAQKINVRVISATRKNLPELVQKGLFREDLYYRIKVIQLDLPPLKARIDDIEPLIAHFTEVYNKQNGAQKSFQKRTLDVLKKYAWPGNIRELQGVVERLIATSDNTLIGPKDLDENIEKNLATTSVGLNLEEYRKKEKIELHQFLMAIIEECGGVKTEAARRLGVSEQHLRHLLKSCEDYI